MIYEKTVNVSYLVEVTLKLILLMLWLFPTFDIVEFHLQKKNLVDWILNIVIFSFSVNTGLNF